MGIKPRLAILTTSRADFSLLLDVVRLGSKRFEVDLLVGGSHFLDSLGFTYNEIRTSVADIHGLNVVPFDQMVERFGTVNQADTLTKSLLAASNWFDGNKPDLLLFLGDRWELWGFTLAAFLKRIPLGHVSGGEVTEGVIDESIRHAHTKLSALHFVASNTFARNVSSMGEEDWRIRVVGECGIDAVHNSQPIGRDILAQRLGVKLVKPFFLITFHVPTLEDRSLLKPQVESILSALGHFPDFQFIFTAPGVEEGAEIIIREIKYFIERYANACLIESAGGENFLNLIRLSELVIGNSSAGIVLAPSLQVPTLNIGNRQKNRPSASSVIHVGYGSGEIQKAIEFIVQNKSSPPKNYFMNPYDPFMDGASSLRIIDALENTLKHVSKATLLRKKFDSRVRSDLWGRPLTGES